MQTAREQRRGRALPKVISFDEMWTYIGAWCGERRRECWVSTAVVEESDGRKWVDFQVGDRFEATFFRLYERLREAEKYHTAAYRVYGWLPAGKHEVGNGGQVNRNEGLHSRSRDKLNWLHRRTKGYSKSMAMLSDSIALVCLNLKLI